MIANRIKEILMYCVCESIDITNRFNGFQSNYAKGSSVKPCEVFDLRKKGYAVRDTKICLNGEVIGKVVRKYASRKVNLTYKELKPTLVFFNE